MPMKVLMLGWEFPPHISGGLGTACYGITKALTNLGVDVVFILPRAVTTHWVEERLEVVSTPGHEQASGPGAQEAVPQRNGSHAHAGAHAPPVRTPQRKPELHPQPGQTGSEGGQLGRLLPAAQGTLEFHFPEIPRVTFRTIDVMLSPYMTAEQYAAHLAKRKHEPRGHAPANLPPSAASALPAPRAGAPAAALQPRFSHGPAPGPQIVPTATAPATVKRSIVSGGGANYAGDMLQETQRYAALAAAIAHDERFDVVHAHDWMTFPAGMAVAAARKKPLVVHVHSTQVDRGGVDSNRRIFEIEKHGMEVADHVVAVSQFTKNLIVEHYGIAPEKISVVHNGVEPCPQRDAGLARECRITEDEKVVLFLGRITAQKGPEQFLAAARKVVDVYPDVKFVMAGSGDLMQQCIELAARLGIGHKVLFAGFLQGNDVERVFAAADLYVMPSVSEPFGIAPLEAMSREVPVIISKQSGVSEVVDQALKVDFWDTDDLANKIVAVLRYPPLSNTLRQRGTIEITQLTWSDTARKIREVYMGLLAKSVGVVPPRHPGEPPPVAAPAAGARPKTPPAPRRGTAAPKPKVVAKGSTAPRPRVVTPPSPKPVMVHKPAVAQAKLQLLAMPKLDLAAKPKASPKPKIAPRTKAMIKPEPKTKSAPKAKMTMRPTARVKPKPAAVRKTKAEIKVKSKPKPKTHPKPKTQATTKATPKPKAKVKLAPKPKRKPKAKVVLKPKPTPKPKAKPKVKPKTKTPRQTAAARLRW